MTDTKEEYRVKTSTFEGPLELLLRLVEEKKLFINEISLSEVTDDYIAYVRSLSSLDLGQISGFLVVAATLILIKSKSLLPNLDLSEDEQTQIDDLERRLKIYQMIKEVGIEVKNQFGRQIMFFAPERSDENSLFVPDKNITAPNMLGFIESVLAEIPKKDIKPEVEIRKVISLEEMIMSLTERIQKSLNFKWSDIINDKKHSNSKEQKVYVIVSFLAILELVRTGIMEVLQDNNFGEIAINKQQTTNI